MVLLHFKVGDFQKVAGLHREVTGESTHMLQVKPGPREHNSVAWRLPSRCAQSRLLVFSLCVQHSGDHLPIFLFLAVSCVRLRYVICAILAWRLFCEAKDCLNVFRDPSKHLVHIFCAFCRMTFDISDGTFYG